MDGNRIDGVEPTVSRWQSPWVRGLRWLNVLALTLIALDHVDVWGYAVPAILLVIATGLAMGLTTEKRHGLR